MKTYNYNDAKETLAAIFQSQDKATLSKALAKIVMRLLTSQNSMRNVKLEEFEIVVKKEENKEDIFTIKIGDQE